MQHIAEELNAIRYYNENAQRLSANYESLTFETVHQDLIEFLPGLPARVLDLGAGTGRDACALAERGYEVVAVEPAAGLRAIGAALHDVPGLTWRNDRLPLLETLRDEKPFTLLLCSAVWMHLNRDEQKVSMRRLCSLGAPGAWICITFRTRTRGDPVPFFEVEAREVIADAATSGARLIKKTKSADWLQRTDINWTSLIFGIEN